MSVQDCFIILFFLTLSLLFLPQLLPPPTLYPPFPPLQRCVSRGDKIHTSDSAIPIERKKILIEKKKTVVN